jgi:hypothetical protein
MSLMLVPSLPFIVSIFSITRDCGATNEPEKTEIGRPERIAKLAVFSAIAELSAKGREPRAWDIGLLEAGTSVHCSEMLPTNFRCVSSQLQRWAGTQSPPVPSKVRKLRQLSH